MEKHIELVAKSYDKAIEFGRKGIDLYKNLPDYITDDINYPLFLKLETEGSLSDSGRQEIKDFLSPNKDMKFIDLGCCLNLMFRDYDKWPSLYYGVDISTKTIELLQEFVSSRDIPIGGLFCGSMHQTPYPDNFFDIGSCIGSLEYFEKDFIEKAVMEFHRIIKPLGKFVLDIPDVGSPEFQITMKIEEYLGRTDRFYMSIQAFEDLLRACFKIEEKEKVGPMIQYFLQSNKQISKTQI